MSSDLLVRLLRRAGHDVQTPQDLGMMGRSDPVQMMLAVRDNRVCITANYNDYDELHLLILETGGRHPGILVVRQDNDPARDLTAKGIVAAIRNLDAAGIPIQNEYIYCVESLAMKLTTPPPKSAPPSRIPRSASRQIRAENPDSQTGA
jgi:hypothetical protein